MNSTELKKKRLYFTVYEVEQSHQFYGSDISQNIWSWSNLSAVSGGKH